MIQEANTLSYAEALSNIGYKCVATHTRPGQGDIIYVMEWTPPRTLAGTEPAIAGAENCEHVWVVEPSDSSRSFHPAPGATPPDAIRFHCLHDPRHIFTVSRDSRIEFNPDIPRT